MTDLKNKPRVYDFCGLKMDGKFDQKDFEAYKSPPCKKSRKEKVHAKVLTSVSTDLLEQKTWKDLPEDLLEVVIAGLPMESFFRFRTICRKWNSMLISNRFSEHFAEVPHLHPWFYAVTHDNMGNGVMYNPTVRKWYHVYNPYLPATTIILPVASVGGLICSLDLGHTNFYVCNPLTALWKELPPRLFHVWSRVAVGMTLYGNTPRNGYKIMWLGCNADHEFYDSVADIWIRYGTFSRGE